MDYKITGDNKYWPDRSREIELPRPRSLTPEEIEQRRIDQEAENKLLRNLGYAAALSVVLAMSVFGVMQVVVVLYGGVTFLLLCALLHGLDS